MSSETRELTVRQFFARGGLLAQCHPSYEFRSGQLEMAEAVESALADRRHLIEGVLRQKGDNYEQHFISFSLGSCGHLRFARYCIRGEFGFLDP